MYLCGLLLWDVIDVVFLKSGVLKICILAWLLKKEKFGMLKCNNLKEVEKHEV
jgi:hypothetical protein